MPRRSRARTWVSFPSNYYELLDRFSSGETRVEIPVDGKGVASAVRQDLYRFFAALREAAVGEAYPRKYDQIARELMIQITDSAAVLSVRPLGSVRIAAPVVNAKPMLPVLRRDQLAEANKMRAQFNLPEHTPNVTYVPAEELE